MKIGTTYQHTHLPTYSCVPQEFTARGCKVTQTQKFPGTRKKDKVTTAFYDAQDFGKNPLWAEAKL